MMFAAILFSVLVCSVKAQHTFPPEFQFGVATASYQVEGAWDVDGKGENIWDRLTHTRTELIADGSNGDDACNAYYKTEEDVQLLVDLKVNFYRFSISWSRILPTGYTNQINQAGIDYYRELIDTLLRNNIEPFVTMFHWDLPQPLQEIGGFPNPLLADIFADYADILYEYFGDQVKNWITFNEPMQICEQGYSIADKAPAYSQEGIGGYLCAHTLLIAHAKAYRLYYDKYHADQLGRVGITIDTGISIADTNSVEDLAAAERSMEMNYGWYAHPIFSEEGDYPPIMRERIDALSISQGFPQSRLPRFTEEEVAMLKGSSDFLGLNHYTSGHCLQPAVEFPLLPPSHSSDIGVTCYQPPEWGNSGSTWLKVYPEGLRLLLMWIRDHYNNPEVIITENGFSDLTGTLQDCDRVNYFNLYLTELLKAIHEEGCNVSGYTAWSFMDNFEWRRGYTERFGIHYVDFASEQKTRTPKLSAYVFRDIIENRAINWDFEHPDFEACDFTTPEENEINSETKR